MNDGMKHGTTIVVARRAGNVIMGGDGLVSAGWHALAHNGNKVKLLGGGKVLMGASGSLADCEAFERALIEGLKKKSLRAALQGICTKWNKDATLRKHNVIALVADAKRIYHFDATGSFIELDVDFASIGSGSHFAWGAGEVLIGLSERPLRRVVEQALAVAARHCVFTNAKRTIIELGGD